MAKSVASITLSVLLLAARIGIAADAAIPKNLAEAHGSLTRHLTSADVDRIRAMKSEDEMIRVIGLSEASALTNEWQLWGDSPLARYFKRLGVAEPHDMVGIVAETFWCKIHKRPFALRAKVTKLKQHYAREKAREESDRPKGNSPRDGAKIDWFYQTQDSTGSLHLGVSKSDGSFWRYDRRDGRGIQPARPDEAKMLEDIVRAGKEAAQ